MIGLRGIISEMMISQWIRLQPQVFLITSLWFIALGIALVVDGEGAVKAAKLGTFFYIGFAVLNELAIQMVLIIPYAGIFILSFIGTSILMGVLLAIAVQKMALRLQ